MTDLKELVADLINISQPLVKATMDLDNLADHYDKNTWLSNQLLGLENDLDKVINKLNDLKNIYDFKGGELSPPFLYPYNYDTDNNETIKRG